jgi:hypothetical protein
MISMSAYCPIWSTVVNIPLRSTGVRVLARAPDLGGHWPGVASSTGKRERWEARAADALAALTAGAESATRSERAALHDGVAIQTVKRFGRHLPAELRTALDLGPVPDFTGRQCADCGQRWGLDTTTSTQ